MKALDSRRSAKGAPGAVPLFRWYSGARAEHFYTTDPEGERAQARGIGPKAFSGTSRPRRCPAPWRFTAGGTPPCSDHFYTTDPEGELAPQLGYEYEGVVGHVLPAEANARYGGADGAVCVRCRRAVGSGRRGLEDPRARRRDGGRRGRTPVRTPAPRAGDGRAAVRARGGPMATKKALETLLSEAPSVGAALPAQHDERHDHEHRAPCGCVLPAASRARNNRRHRGRPQSSRLDAFELGREHVPEHVARREPLARVLGQCPVEDRVQMREAT